MRIKEFFEKNNFGVVNVYQNYDQLNYFIVFQKEECGTSFKKIVDSENGLKKCTYIKFMKILKNFLVVIHDINVYLEDYDCFLKRKERTFASI